MKRNQRKELLNIAKKLKQNNRLNINEVQKIVDTDLESDDENKVLSWVKNLSFPVSIAIGIFLVSFPEISEKIANNLTFLNLPNSIAAALDYIWGIIGNAVEKTHLIYHIPNIILYSFGIFGIKTLFESINKTTWKDKVSAAQSKLQNQIEKGRINLTMPKGFSVLFVGNGDFIGEEFVKRNTDDSIILSSKKPEFTNIWGNFGFDDSYEKLKKVLQLIDVSNAGEYIFFPVIDDQIYLPGNDDFDIAPHKLDLIIQNIRSIERELGFAEKRIIIVGDKYHRSDFITVNMHERIADSEETLTIEKIAEKHNKVSIIDPTDLVSDQINKISKGRKVLFRASHTGVDKYKARFFSRLMETSYHEKSEEPITIGYDLFEDLIEQQSKTWKQKKYTPVVLSSHVYEALKREGYEQRDIIYVPHLVLREIQEESDKQ